MTSSACSANTGYTSRRRAAPSSSYWLTTKVTLTAGKDHRTYALAQAILNEEIEHESWLSEFPGGGPSGHFMRRGETSPFVRPFLQ
jgi:hypothetical protein